MLGAFLPKILTPMKLLQVSEPFVRTSSCLVSCWRWARFSSDSPAMRVTKSAGMAETVTGEKISPSGDISLASMTSTAISSTKRFKATYTSIQEGQQGIDQSRARIKY